jgi:hypothetical protein
MEQYQILYDAFLSQYNKGETSPSQVGEVLARIAGLFPNYNLVMIKAEKEFALVHKTIADGSDDTTGKAISSSKAEVLADATPEAYNFKIARGHKENIEMLVGSLKFLQKSLEVEYLNSNI